MTKVKLNNLIRRYTALTFLIVFVVGCIFMINIASAASNNTAHWQVIEVTSCWNAVYGQVTGLSLEDGDSVGMFDVKGNCYGAGLVRGGYYFLSAFGQEEANPEVPDDFAIPGFKDGDRVVFKAYKESTGEEYIIAPASGDSYTYTYQGKYPPMRIDLVYEEAYASPPVVPSEPKDTTASSPSSETIIYPDASGLLAKAEKTEQEESGKTQEPPKEIEERVSRGEPGKNEGAISTEPVMVEPSYEESYTEEEQTDYEEKEEPSALTKPLRRTIQPSSDVMSTHPSRYTSPYKEEGKETVTAGETVLVKTSNSEPTVVEKELEKKEPAKEPAKKRLPILSVGILICAASILAWIFVKKRKK